MTRRQLTDPFGSDEEEENIQIIDEKWSQSISINKSETPIHNVSMFECLSISILYSFICFIYHISNIPLLNFFGILCHKIKGLVNYD